MKKVNALRMTENNNKNINFTFNKNSRMRVSFVCELAHNSLKTTIEKIKNDKVYVFDDSWLNRPGPRLVVGFEQLARVIHPECF